MASNGTLLKTKDVLVAFGGLTALRNVNIHISKGEILSLIGPNGAGKTTLLNVLSGFLKPQKGSVKYKEREIAGLPPYKIVHRGLSRTFQNTSVFYNLTVFQNVLSGVHCKTQKGLLSSIFKTVGFKQEEKYARTKTLEILATMDMEKQKNILAKNLPFGDQRKLGIAIALATQPDLLLLDEPAAGLNPDESQRLMELIRKLKTSGITILLVEHDMKVVMGMSDRIVVLNHGELIAEGTASEIVRNEEVIRVYLGHSSFAGTT